MSKYIGLLATATLMMGTAITSYSGTLTVDEARALAAEFMSSKKGKAPEAIRLNQVPTSESTSAPLYYVFNTADNAGFVIIAAEASATPVLGYSFDGSYPAAASLPEPMQWVMSGIEREIKAAPSMQTANTTAELRRMARSAGQRAAEKLLSTPSWSQEGPFNSMIPGQPLVGCVGTAMATVMKYHNFPESGSGSFGGVDFNVNYDWDSMRADNYRSGYTQTEGEAVATLMYHASKSIDTQYAKSGSSAYEVRVPGALSTYFGYDPGVSYKKRAEVATQQEWDDIVKDEIDAGRPVIYCGQDVTAGHAFVCDGYQGNYLHFNWGWGGSANGYFLSTALNPTVSRQHNYNNLNTIIYNIKPGSGAISSWSPIHITADGNQVGMGSDLTDLSSGKTFTVRVGNLKNLSYDDFSGKIAVALYGSNGAMKTLLSTPANFNMQSMAMLLNGYMDLSGCKLPAGATVADDDVVRIATQAAGSSEWLPVAGELPTINELAANGSFTKTFAITLPTGVTGVSISGDPSVIPGWNYSFQVTPENALENVVTVKANGYVLTPGNNYTYVINNVREDQNVTVLVQNAADVIAKRSIWVENPGTLSTLIAESETGTIKDLTLFGSIDARDFEFMRTSMQLNRVDLSGVYIAAYGTDQANAMPRNAFRGARTINEVIIPKSVNRFNNGCFFQCGISSITIPSGVKTYEYNVFVGDTNLRDIYVGRENAEFINWCVLSGVKVDLVTLHVPTERAVTNYRNAENWGTIANIIVDPIVESSTDVLFAVMDDADVKYESDILPGKMEKGASVSFAASLIPDNDNRMEVYANSTLLTPDANGIYTTTLNTNTIIHFNMVSPTKVESYKSAWTLTDKNGSVGLLTDAVNVLPGQDFTIRVNALNIPQYYDQLYWAAALTDAEGNIKEFISPVNLWTAGAGDGMKMNVTCCVKDSKVREGNTIRLVTSVNKRNWTVVTGAKSEITDAIPALNNQTEVYNIALNTQGNASVTGVPETAVRGRDITIKATPASAAHRMDLTIDGKLVAQGAASINHTFVVMADVDIDLKVFDPKQEGTTLNTNTIIHFNMVSPTKVESYKSAWTLTDKNGSVGLLTDAVNVLPGQDFTIRVNALNIPQYYDQLYWAAALTDAEGNIKEFISPVNLWTAGAGDGMKMNVTCCVKDSKVREGNTIRLVTSVNKRNWTVVTGAKSEITDAIPALNNQTEVYNIALNTQGNASVTGVPETAVRGRDITIKATPASAAHRMDLTIDGKLVAQGAASINHTFVVMADVDIDLKVFDPKQEGTVTYNVSPGELYKAVTAATVMPNVVVTGEVYGRDLSRAFSQDFAAKTIKKLDLSGVKIVANVISPTDKYDGFSDFIPSNMLYNPTSVNAVMPVVEEILLPDGVQTIAEGAFTNCANLKEIRLPSSLTTEKRVVGYFASGSERKGFAIDRKAFAGCTSLKKIYLPCAPGVVNGRQVVCFADPYGSYANGVNSGLTVFDGSTQLYDLGFWQDGKPNASDITLIVPAEYLSVYKTKYNDANYGNPWVAYNYNILSEDPVYGVNFDASRVAPVDPSTDITKLASFLGENVPLTSIKAENVLKLVKPEASCLVFDNGQPIQPTEDGLISVEFFNPAKDAAAAGNHNITVVYTCDLAFNTTSSLFTIAEPEVINDSEYKSGAFDRTDALAPVLKSVAENSTVRFRLDFHSEHDAALETHVMDGQQEIMADADGIYTVNIATAGKTIDIFAVPTNGATLNAEEIASLDPAQSAAITDIALTGEMSAEALAQAIECFPSLENLDLSDLEGELPDGAFQGMAALTSVTLPEVETITDNMFSGCSSLQNVDIPASVNSIGAGAFEGCSSLSSVSLTGVTEIGEGAFNGCDNLTTITLLADAAGSASHNAPARKPRRAAGITEDSFSGLNPNCFVILDEGVTIPVAGRNVLNTTTGMIDDIDADGNPTRREGRIYTAAASVNFNSANPLAIPYNFTLAEDASITLSVENEKWNSLVAPFDVEKITDEAGNEMEVTVYDPKARNAEGFYLYTLAEGAENLSSVASAKANTPYLFHAPESGVYHFSATGVAVSATPATVGVEGKDYGLHATYAATEVPAADTYVLSEDAWAFIPVDTDDETVTIAPNTVYATSPVKVAEIPTLLPDAEQTTAIDDIEWDGTELTVAIYGKTLVVYSPEARTEIIYSTDGRAVKALALNAGRNDFHLDLNGIYIVAGTKVKI